MINGNGVPARWLVLLQILGWLAAVMLAYAAMSARVAVAEAQIDSLRRDVQNLRDYVKGMEDRRR